MKRIYAFIGLTMRLIMILSRANGKEHIGKRAMIKYQLQGAD
jgi:hypothetical protein